MTFILWKLPQVFFLHSHYFLSLMFLLQMVEHERVLRGSTSRTMAAISLGFIVIVTPYTIQEVVAACTGSKVIMVLLLFAVIAEENKWNWKLRFATGVADSTLSTRYSAAAKSCRRKILFFCTSIEFRQ